MESARLVYLIRDFEAASFEARKNFIRKLVEEGNEVYVQNRFSLRLYDEYLNMANRVEDHGEILDLAVKAIEEAGLTPKRMAVRGGTDGSRLSYMGLPTPNLFTGGHNAHGPFEYIPVESMVKAVEVIMNISRGMARN